MNRTISETAKWLSERDDILLLTHVRPDGDTLGSAAALAAAMQKAGKCVFLQPNPGVTVRYQPWVEKYYAPADFTEPHWIVSVDIASEGLFPDSFAPFRGKVDYAIDHHSSNTGFAKETCVMPQKAACGEIILDLMDEMGLELDEETANLLYLALSTDTGCFRYDNTNADTLYAASRLLTAGADSHSINKQIFRTKAKSRLAIEGMVIQNLKYVREGTVAVVVITPEMIEAAHADEDDMDSISSLPVEIEGVEVGATVRQLKPGVSKISLRTNGKVNASRICSLFGGGGHLQAAGCTIQEEPQKAAQTIAEAICTHWED